MAMHVPQSGALTHWVERIQHTNIRSFSGTLHDIARIASSEKSSASDLAHVILRDPALTARLLRVANNVLVNPGGRTINTVSRAVVVLGFSAVHQMSLSIAIIESLPRGSYRKRLVRELALCFHAATQAGALAGLCGDRAPEEIFVAGLLYRLGEIAFWSSGDAALPAVDRALDARCGPPESEKTVLGFSFQDLTMQLNNKWKTSHLLADILSETDQESRGRYVQYGYEVAEVAARGWPAHDAVRLANRLAEKLPLSAQALTALFHRSALEAARNMSSYEAREIGDMIPPPPSRPDNCH